MREFIQDFQKRVEEIEKYFELVDRIEELGTFSEDSITFPSGEYTVDSDLQKILKSHCYLLLYNLVESSIRNGIIAIHDSIFIDKLNYRDLSPKIQVFWLLNDQSKSFRDSYIKKETIADNLQKVIEKVLDDRMTINLDIYNIPISGNLDAKTIQKLTDMYGFYGQLGVPSQEIDKIVDSVVKIRCDLAHGNMSFSEASKQRIWTEIVNDKDQLIKYLTHLLGNIDNYIENKKYRI